MTAACVERGRPRPLLQPGTVNGEPAPAREARDPAVREIIVGRVLYELKPDAATVDVLRIWHAARGRPEL